MRFRVASRIKLRLAKLFSYLKNEIYNDNKNNTTFSSNRCNSVIKHNYFIINA